MSPPSSSMAVKHGPCLLALRKGSRPSKLSDLGNFSASPTWNTTQDQRLGVEEDQLPCEVYRNLFWQSGMSHATAVSLKPSGRTPLRVRDAAVGRGNARWTTSESGHPWPCQKCSQRPPTEKTGRVSLLNRPSSPPVDPFGQETELI